MRNLSLKINWMSIVMLVSLGINFFVIGYIYAEHKAKEIRMTRLSFDNSVSKLIEPFPRSSKHDFYVTMRSKRDELVPIYREIMQQRALIMDIIAQETLDSEKLRTAMREYHEIYHKLIYSTQDVMVGIVDDLDAEERQKILERFKNPPKRQFRGRSDDDRRRSPESGSNGGGRSRW